MWEGTFFKEIRSAAKSLGRRPSFAAVGIAVLALGIGVTSAMFALVDAALLRPLPYARGLVQITGLPTFSSNPAGGTSLPWANWAEHSPALEDISVWAQGTVNLTGITRPHQCAAAEVSGRFFAALGIVALHGRLLSQEDGRLGRPNVVVLSTRLWSEYFHSDSRAIGKVVLLSGRPYVVVGVAPSFLHLPRGVQLWVPYPRDAHNDILTESHGLSVLARVKSVSTLAEARREVAEAARSFSLSMRFTFNAEVTPLRASLVGSTNRDALLMLLCSVGAVLLICCGNVGGLLLVRAISRTKEFAIRSALGAGRTRLVVGALAESAVLAALGGICGLILGCWLIWLLWPIAKAELPFLGPVGLDFRVAAFALTVTIIAGLVSGVYPAIQLSRSDLNQALKLSFPTRTGRGIVSMSRAMDRLVIGQIALALVLLIGAGLLVGSLVRLAIANPGFEPAEVVTTKLMLAESRYSSPEARYLFYQALISRAKALPGVLDAGVVSNLPLSDEAPFVRGVILGGGAEFSPLSGPFVRYVVASPGYFRSMGIPLLAGRLPGHQGRIGSQYCVLVNAALAHQFWPGRNAVGERIRLAGDPSAPPVTVAGVVSNVRQEGLASRPQPEIYVSLREDPSSVCFLVVRTRGRLEAVVSSLRAIIRAVDPAEPPGSFVPMAELVSRAEGTARFRAMLLSSFAGLALLLAVVGLYGMMSYSIAHHSHDIAVRMALGATRADVLRVSLGQGLRLICIGVFIGILVSVALTRVLSSVLYGISALDPRTFGAAVVALVSTGFLAAYVPARRATRVDPASALREE
jgi:putative ABC transport system permease protein